MARYEEILPGFSERLLRRLEREGEHRQSTETKIVDAEIAKQNADIITARRGQDYAFAIAFVGLLSSAVGIYLAPTPEHAYAAASIAGASLATLVGIFVLGRKLKPSSEAADEESKTQDGQRSLPAPTDKAK